MSNTNILFTRLQSHMLRPKIYKNERRKVTFTRNKIMLHPLSSKLLRERKIYSNKRPHNSFQPQNLKSSRTPNQICSNSFFREMWEQGALLWLPVWRLLSKQELWKYKRRDAVKKEASQQKSQMRFNFRYHCISLHQTSASIDSTVEEKTSNLDTK